MFFGGDNLEAKKYDALKLGVQLSFPLYACAKEVVRVIHKYEGEK